MCTKNSPNNTKNGTKTGSVFFSELGTDSLTTLSAISISKKSIFGVTPGDLARPQTTTFTSRFDFISDHSFSQASEYLEINNSSQNPK